LSLFVFPRGAVFDAPVPMLAHCDANSIGMLLTPPKNIDVPSLGPDGHWNKRKMLRPNPPEVRVTIGQESSTKIIYIVLQTSVRLFLQKKILSIATPKVENKCWTSYETLESTDEVKPMTKFCLCLHKFSELWNLFSLVPLENCSRCYVKQLLMCLALQKCKNDCIILKIILVPDFCPLKPEIARFSIGFRLTATELAISEKRVFVWDHSYENVVVLQVFFHGNQTHFHIKGFARGLVLKQRLKVTLKQPITIS